MRFCKHNYINKLSSVPIETLLSIITVQTNGNECARLIFVCKACINIHEVTFDSTTTL